MCVGGEGGGGQSVCWRLSQIIGEGGWPPSSYAYVHDDSVMFRYYVAVWC